MTVPKATLITTCFLLFIFLQTLDAQEFSPVFKHLTVEEGLSNNWVKAILKDQQGFMWFGTFNGLNRYDGKDFKIFRADQTSLLSDNFITSLAEDQTGNLWVGTFSGGLNLFDRKTETFRQYRHQPDQPSSLSHDKIHVLFCDREGRLWIGTEKGLDIYLPDQKAFKHFTANPQQPGSITPGPISCIFQDSEGRIWVGTTNGLNRYDPGKNTFHHYTNQEDYAGSLAHNYVTSMYEDKYRELWVGTWGGGLSRMDPESGVFSHFKADAGRQGKLGNNSVLAVAGDGEDQIYVATEGGGLSIFDIQNQKFRNFAPQIADERSINSNSLHALFFDQENGLTWIGSYNGGINYFSKWDKPFILYQAETDGLNNEHINAVAEDQSGKIWIGTDGGGINILDPIQNSYTYLQQAGPSKEGLQNNAVLSLLCDRDNYIWVGTYNGGLDRISPDRRSMMHFHTATFDSLNLSGKSVNAIYQDRRGNIWIGTMNGGLNLFWGEKKGFKSFQHHAGDENSIIDNFIYGIFEDRLGRLLVQTGKGLEIFDYKNESFERFNQSFDTNFDVPLVLMEDSQGNLWIGSQEMGVFRVDRTGVKFDNYNTRDGLPSNSIAGILEDDSGNLWISTAKGLCKFEEGVIKPEKVQLHIYSIEDGLQGTEFKRGAYCKLKNGNLIFAGQNGFNIFDPLEIKNNPFIPPVVFTDFKLFNKDVDFNQSDILSAPISQVQSLEIPYQQSVFTFEFAALNFMLSEKNQYAYMMEGFEESWNFVGTKNNATYTNLDAGTYTFRVKAANNDGEWNEEGNELEITILPPWWENNYFRIGVILLFLGSVFGYYRYRTFQLKRSKRILEKKVSIRTRDLREATAISEARQKEIMRQNEALVDRNEELARKSEEIKRMAEKIKDLNEAKLRFFTNISHELRTPLNLILWPLEELLNQGPSRTNGTREKYQLMHKNANKLIKLINQLLDFRKLETEALQLYLQRKEVISVIRDIFDSFNDWAERKQITYQLETQIDKLEINIDEDKLEKILSNLLSNAFKFVDSGGNITVTVEVVSEKGLSPHKQSNLRIGVIDDGKGISEAQLDLIFNRFYEGKSSGFPGSGIGLALVKELVSLHKGKVWVNSQEAAGSAFYFQIPTNLELNSQAVFLSETVPPDIPTEVIPPDTEIDSPLIAPSLLLVEDNTEILHFMYQKLKSSYEVILAGDGEAGLEMAFEHVPDLIISDVMMPKMDGLELCKKIKNDPRTSHIPIIMVTARSGEENQLEGLLTGADDYITKPYQFDLLQLKIKNILFTRQKLKEQFIKDSLTIPDNFNISSVDEAFLRKATQAVKENIQNSEFGVEDFSEYFNMSRRNVLRKMKGLTGLSINEYIRSIRLKEAHHLLLQMDLNVSEVAYTVGYTDPKYFSNSFKKHFGYSPSEVKDKER
jgi:ligand-binding sensor domain-containing protein/signal transduction histidine kinase/DNA-binding response OmpR family regulator